MADPELAPNIIEPLKMQGVEQFGDFAIQLRLKMMTKPGEQFVIRRRAYGMIKKAFDANGIEFALPTVTVAGGSEERAPRPPRRAWSWFSHPHRLPAPELIRLFARMSDLSRIRSCWGQAQRPEPGRGQPSTTRQRSTAVDPKTIQDISNPGPTRRWGSPSRSQPSFLLRSGRSPVKGRSRPSSANASTKGAYPSRSGCPAKSLRHSTPPRSLED